jgi:hypothetical protein
MEFGRVPENELDSIDFNLPAEPAGNKKILSGKKKKMLKYTLAAPNGEEQNGLEKFIPPILKKKIFFSIMWSIIILLN